MHAAVEVHRELLDVGARLVSEYVDHPAGSVLRCFARAVRLARRAGALSAPGRPRRIVQI